MNAHCIQARMRRAHTPPPTHTGTHTMRAFMNTCTHALTQHTHNARASMNAHCRPIRIHDARVRGPCTNVNAFKFKVLTLSLSLSLCSDGSRLSCCDVDDSAPQIPPLCHSGCFTNVCPRPFLYVFLPGSCRSPSASLPCSSDI